MRSLVIALIVCSFAFSTAFAAGARHCDRSYRTHHLYDCFLEDVDLDIVGGSIILTHTGRGGGEVEITDEHELYVNGRLVVTDEEQKEMLAEYHFLTFDILEYAKEIGYEGAKIGAAGAAIGLKAVGGVFKALLTEYEFEELEDDLEEQAEELEAKAEKLERKADRLENMADELTEVHEDLRYLTPELRELGWF
jgi:hypothetical protein